MRNKKVIVVTGNPRSRTSMMMHCLSLCGVPLAFTNLEGRNRKEYRNTYGFYEGQWNGEDGAIKCFAYQSYPNYPTPRFIYMDRGVDKIMKSWKEIMPSTIPPEKIQKRKAFITKNKQLRLEAIKEYPHVIIDSDKFVLNPQCYRGDFERVFPELDFDTLIKGIDIKLYVDRGN